MSKIWIFDLDDTLHNASAHIFPVMNLAMTQYMMKYLCLDEQVAQQLRQHYWQAYGATLKGLMRHHGITPAHFLFETHQFNQLADMVVKTKRLRHTIQNLAGRKVIFINAPRQYALRVLNLMGISDLFELVFSVESAQYHAKPSMRGFKFLLKSLRVKAGDYVMLEDNLAALMTAKRLGMKTVWVSNTLKKKNFVDYRINSVLALTHIAL